MIPFNGSRSNMDCDKAMYSASVADRAITFCNLFTQNRESSLQILTCILLLIERWLGLGDLRVSIALQISVVVSCRLEYDAFISHALQIATNVFNHLFV